MAMAMEVSNQKFTNVPSSKKFSSQWEWNWSRLLQRRGEPNEQDSWWTTPNTIFDLPWTSSP
jgi:hypothetical protein